MKLKIFEYIFLTFHLTHSGKCLVSWCNIRYMESLKWIIHKQLNLYYNNPFEGNVNWSQSEIYTNLASDNLTSILIWWITAWHFSVKETSACVRFLTVSWAYGKWIVDIYRDDQNIQNIHLQKKKSDWNHLTLLLNRLY